MTKTNLKILDWEAKVDKSGKKQYARFKTDQGWMSAFEQEIINELKACVGKTVICEVAVSDDGAFKNIRGFGGVTREEFAGAKCVDERDDLEIEERPERSSPNRVPVLAQKEIPLSMQVSYAKDIFIELSKKVGLEEIDEKAIMKSATDLIKQAIWAFVE